MRIMVLLAVLLVACGGETADDPVITSPPPPDATDATGAAETLTGTLGGDAQLEGGCAWLDAEGQRWEVLYPSGWTVSLDPLTLEGPDGQTAGEGDTVTVTGGEETDAASICMVGRIWRATSVEIGG